MGRRHSKLRARCDQLVTALALDERRAASVSVGAVAASVQRLRARPLRLVPADTRPGSPTGMWIETELADYVFYERLTSPLHQLHIVLHEVGHMLLGHSGVDGGMQRNLSKACPALSPDTEIRIRSRSPQLVDTDDEREAEVFATVACQRLSSVREDAPPYGADRDLLTRLTCTLSDRSGSTVYG